jgi:threonine dehydrogenase-like Zn-dependent dehydrogenase
VIREIGAGVPASRGLRVGDHVAVQPTISCGSRDSCGACAAHAENVCPKGGFVGLSGGGGGMSEFVVVPEAAVFLLPKNVELDTGALVEPLAVAWHAVDASPIAALREPKCLVIGGGPIGLAVLQVLLARGAHTGEWGPLPSGGGFPVTC